VIIVADSTKFGRQGLAHLCPLSEIDRIVVDNGISEDWRSRMLAAGVNLVVAGGTDNTPLAQDGQMLPASKRRPG